MAKYLMLWKLNTALTPINPQERAKGYSGLLALVQQDIEKGLSKDWGCFVGEGNGYCVVEGSEVDISKMVQQYSPFCKFTSHPVASAEQMIEAFNSMMG